MDDDDAALPLATQSAARSPRIAFSYCVPIGVLGGLIGLGGAEFRLPVLAGTLRYPARKAIALNLAISFITLAASLAVRSRSLTLDTLRPFSTAIVSMTGGAVVAAFFGTAIAKRLSNETLHRIILGLLLGIGALLITEGFAHSPGTALVPPVPAWQVCAGVLTGSLIGLVSILLGVAGGELIIPTMVFAFGADIMTAGTASVLISLPTVTVGVMRYARQRAFTNRRDIRETVLPMGAGSIIGAVIGGALLGIVAPDILKIGLGCILIFSAIRVFFHRRV